MSRRPVIRLRINPSPRQPGRRRSSRSVRPRTFPKPTPRRPRSPRRSRSRQRLCPSRRVSRRPRARPRGSSPRPTGPRWIRRHPRSFRKPVRSPKSTASRPLHSARRRPNPSRPTADTRTSSNRSSRPHSTPSPARSRSPTPRRRGRSRPSSGRVVGDERRGRFPCSSRGACCNGPRPWRPAPRPRGVLCGAPAGLGPDREARPCGTHAERRRPPRLRAVGSLPTRLAGTIAAIVVMRWASPTDAKPTGPGLSRDTRWAFVVSVRRVPHHLHVERRGRETGSLHHFRFSTRYSSPPSAFIRFGRGAWDHRPLAQHLPGCPCGLAPEAVVGLFQLFSQVDGTHDRSRSGLGIGLALVKSLVELHGGSVGAASDGPGRGSEFTVRLPACGEGGVGG